MRKHLTKCLRLALTSNGHRLPHVTFIEIDKLHTVQSVSASTQLPLYSSP